MLRILIPMAGGGTRFAGRGYPLPKPLLPVMGAPMCVRAAQALPTAEEHIFIVQEQHEKDYGIHGLLTPHFKGCRIMEINGVTEGQAVTCLMASDYIDNADELIIGACDNGMIYDREKFDREKANADAVIFTFRNSKAVASKPEAYGWVVENGGVVERVSVKIPISDKPMNDPAVVGAFWFREGKIFVEAAQKMIAENRRINGEFYVDECLNDALDMGYIVKIFDIDAYLGWGTPDDYETWNYWSDFFSAHLKVTGHS